MTTNNAQWAGFWWRMVAHNKSLASDAAKRGDWDQAGTWYRQAHVNAERAEGELRSAVAAAVRRALERADTQPGPTMLAGGQLSDRKAS